MSEDITRFMCARHLGITNVIPLWNPSSSLKTGRRERLRRIDVGDVGVINVHGGFDVSFNILLDRDTNISCGYNSLPPNFVKFVASQTPQEDSWDDNEAIDVGACDAIDHGNIRAAGAQPYFTGGFNNITQTNKDKGK